MKIAWMRMWIVLQLFALSGMAHANASPSNTPFSSECCYAQLALNTAQKVEDFCRQHRHPLQEADGTDPCQFEKDAVQQISSEYARSAGSTGTCDEACSPASVN